MSVSEITHIQPSEIKKMSVTEMIGLIEYLDEKRKQQEKLNREMKNKNKKWA